MYIAPIMVGDGAKTFGEKLADLFKSKSRQEQEASERRENIRDYYSGVSQEYELIQEIYQKYGKSAAEQVVAELGFKDFDWSGIESNLNSDYSFGEYLEGLLSSQGAENEINRKFNAAQNLLNREFQAEQAQIQRDWYEAQSNSAYQRAVVDMQAAGINPILAYQQGGAASSGTGVPAGSAASYTATGGDSLSSILTAFADVIGSVTSAVTAGKKDYAKALYQVLAGK